MFLQAPEQKKQSNKQDNESKKCETLDSELHSSSKDLKRKMFSKLDF